MYATPDQITSLYGRAALIAADRDGDGAPDPGVLEEALERAAGEIDVHIAARYALPLESVPAHLTTICADIALYRLAQTADLLTEELRRRYEDAIGFLRRVADGKAALLITSSETAEGAPAPGPRPIVTTGPERLFSRDKTRGL